MLIKGYMRYYTLKNIKIDGKFNDLYKSEYYVDIVEKIMKKLKENEDKIFLNINKCPFTDCDGSAESLIIKRDPLNTMKWYGWVECDYCGARGPVGASEQEAIDLWNNRR